MNFNKPLLTTVRAEVLPLVYSRRWATFVANRTSQIQKLTCPSIWRYVPTRLNPVDCASRGLLPSELVNRPLWWTGPPFLIQSDEQWPTLPELHPKNIEHTGTEESKRPIVFLVIKSSITSLLDRYSSLNTILRIIAYCLRFCKHCRADNTLSSSITADEIAYALLALIFCTQRTVYSTGIARLNKGGLCSNKLRSLDPFIDEHGIIRVGGRRVNVNIPYAHKHPILLPSPHPLTALIIDYHHSRLKRPGTHALQTQLQREYWIQARRVIRSRLRLCIPCFRTRPHSLQPKMAPLPKYRVQQIKPFAISGIDYTSPVILKGLRGRQSTKILAYLSIYKYMSFCLYEH